MPQIQDELERSINDTHELLSRLPPPPTSDPCSEILFLLHKFSQDLTQQIEGVPDGIDSVAEQGLIQAIRPEQEKFQKAIRATAPKFSPLEKSLVSAKSWERRVCTPGLLFYEEGFGKDAANTAPPNYVDEVLERASLESRYYWMWMVYAYVMNSKVMMKLIYSIGTDEDKIVELGVENAGDKCGELTFNA
jgi:hypothetical protein